MPMVIAFISQKGGVGKSTLARALGSVVAHGGLSVLIADLDTQQSTSLHWQKLRQKTSSDAEIDVHSYPSVDDAVLDADDYDVLIIDAPGRVSRSTLEIARTSHLVVIPTGPSLDDLHPTVLLHHELTSAGIGCDRIVCAICRTLSKEEERDAREYLTAANCIVLPGALPERAAYRSAHNQGRSITETENLKLNATADALIETWLNRIAAKFERPERERKSKKKGSSQ